MLPTAASYMSSLEQILQMSYKLVPVKIYISMLYSEKRLKNTSKIQMTKLFVFCAASRSFIYILDSSLKIVPCGMPLLGDPNMDQYGH